MGGAGGGVHAQRGSQGQFVWSGARYDRQDFKYYLPATLAVKISCKLSQTQNEIY